MSWELAERLRARFPEVELFPRPAGDHREEGPVPESPPGPAPPSGAPAQPAPRRPAHEAAPSFLTPGVVVPQERLLEICRTLAGPEFGLAYLSLVTAIDRPGGGELEVLYHLYSFDTREELALKVRLPRDAAAVPSVTGIWDGANWHERETYDLFGVIFEGHPNLRRIMMTDDWVGHPLRKDYVYQDPPWLVEAARQRQDDIEGFGLGERA